MEVAVAAIALITIFCGKSICLEDSSSKLKLNAQKSKHLDDMREYMEYMVLEEQLSQAGGARQHR